MLRPWGLSFGQMRRRAHSFLVAAACLVAGLTVTAAGCSNDQAVVYTDWSEHPNPINANCARTAHE